ncbi:ATP-binding protein [Streptomyces sp. TRM70350]|uniref:ATP-binding protein n=1 Tax=Streptomyces sp. TRM70350 TaxID=2856165 RepID=UPI001C493BC3|nr:ATP-binding protein [Streptomyces sp. TRM70350]MBV7700680.1 ATP-binding protein [Streptomyces sp. TRM70350]
MSNRLDLAAVLTAVSCSRAFAKLTLDTWGASSIVDDALIVVSELVTNAIKATGVTTPRPKWTELDELKCVTVRLVGLDECVVVEVWDVDSHLPEESEAGIDAESGRGLWLVAELAGKWGSYPVANGKVVWAELSLRPTSSQPPAPPLTKRRRKPVPEPRVPIFIQRDP